jgi:hypothetical protein
MNARSIERIQTIVEQAACILLAGAVAFATYRSLGALVRAPQFGVCVAVSALVAYFLASLGFFQRSAKLQQFPMVDFEPSTFELSEPDELVLGESDMLPAQPKPSDPDLLILDEIIDELGPNSRVVRLFDRSAMPIPGSLKSRIDARLGQGRSPSTLPDASQALSEALAELRRSLH